MTAMESKFKTMFLIFSELFKYYKVSDRHVQLINNRLRRQDFNWDLELNKKILEINQSTSKNFHYFCDTIEIMF